MLARVLISCMYIDLGNVWWIITGELCFLHKKKQKGDWKINVITGYFFGFRKIDIEDSLEESLHWISGCLYRWTLCLGCAKCWWVLYNAYIFNRKNTLTLSLFKHVSQELLMVFWKKKWKGWMVVYIQLKLWRTLNNLTLNIWLKGYVLPNILQV